MRLPGVYFWSVYSLESDIQKNEFKEDAQVTYFVLMTVVLIILSSFNEPVTGLVYILEEILLVLVTLIGLWKCYGANRAGRGGDFVTRFTALSFVHGLRLIPIFILVILLLSQIDTKYLEGFFSLGLTTIFAVVGYTLVYRSLIRINKHTAEASTAKK